MKKTTLIAMTLAASLVLVTGSVNAAQTMKPFHKGVSCEACHGEKAPTAPTKTDCSSCHGTPEDVAKLTAGKYKKYYNPHVSALCNVLGLRGLPSRTSTFAFGLQ